MLMEIGAGERGQIGGEAPMEIGQHLGHTQLSVRFALLLVSVVLFDSVLNQSDEMLRLIIF